MSYDGSIRIDTSLDGTGFKKGVESLAGAAGTAIGGIVTAIGAASVALTAGAAAGVKYNAQMEQYITSFGTMLGSAEKAQRLVTDLKEMGAKTPFETADLAKGAQTLLAFGVVNENLLPTMKMIGDVSQGNKEKFDNLTLAFAQIRSGGKLTGQDLLQCVNAGFNPLNEISKTTGKSVAELKDEMSKGAISADMVAEAFQHATSEGGQFYNAMDAQSKTFNGQMSTLKDNALSFLGELTTGLTESLKDTALPMVTGWLAELQSAFSSGDTQMLAKAFGSVLAQVISTIAEEAPGVIASASLIVHAFVDGIQENLPSLADSALAIVSSLVRGIADVFPRAISQPVNEAMDALVKSFQSGGLRTAISTLKNMILSLGNVAGNLAKKVLPLLTKAVDMLGNNLDIVVPLITSAVIATTSWKIAQQAKIWISAASKAITLFAAANVSAATAGAASTASVTLGQFAYGILSGKIGLATAAQALFNTVLNANPIGLAITAIAALTAGIAAVCAVMGDSKERTEQLNSSLGTISDGASEFSSGLSTAKSHLSEFNDTLFATSEEQQTLKDNMLEVQSGITAICKSATAERRQYTDAEVVQLEEYFAKLGALNDAQFAMEAARMDAVKQQAVNSAEMHKGSLAEYEVVAQEWIATAQEQRDKEIALLDEQATTEIVLLNQKYGEQANISNSAYAAELDAISSNKQAKIDLVNASVGEITAAYASGYAERSGLQGLEQQTASSNNLSIESENIRHADALRHINADYVGDSEDKAVLIESVELQHNANLTQIWSDLTGNMTAEQEKQLGVYIGMAAQSELYGGKLTAGASKTAKGIVDSFDSLPSDTREVMKNAMSPMLDEMEKAAPTLFEKASGIANGILNIFKSVFQEASPSRATRKIFKYVMEGSELGLEDETPKLFRMADDIGSGVLERMKSSVSAQHAQLSSRISAAVDYSIAASQAPAAPPAPAAKSIQFGDVILYASPGASESEMSRVLEDYETRADWGIK